MTTKNPKPISEARDPDARNALTALLRASQSARDLAARTNTRFVVVDSSESELDAVNRSKKVSGK